MRAVKDQVELSVAGIKIRDFISYEISADLYTPADVFRLELADPDIDIVPGAVCEVRINNHLELTGIIDKVRTRINKETGITKSIEGRDNMGWLLDCYCGPAHWRTVEGMRLKTLAQLLLSNAPPFIRTKDIIYQENVVGKLKGKKAAESLCDIQDTPARIGQIEPGMTIFDVLKNYSLSRGLLFYCRPDGTLVFGRPLASGTPEFNLTMLAAGTGNNVIESDVEEDISRRYSKVLIVGQQQGDDDIEATQINITTGSREDKEFPFYRLYVETECNDNVSPSQRARIIMEKQRREGTTLNYTVGRHNQNGRNWAMNTICHVRDEKQSLNGKKGIDADYLIYGRTFELTKDNGPRTIVRLGKPGVIA